jgi:putative FmdB family regulatory protein
MPIFEYICQDCGKRQEILLKGRGEDPICGCGSRNLTKLLSAFAVSESSRHSVGGCADGSCGLQRSSCVSGMCGLN